MGQVERKQQVMMVLCLIFFLWHMGTQWTTTLLSFLQWDTEEVMTIVDLGYIQAFGSFMNAIGSLIVGQIADTTGAKTMFMVSVVITSIYYFGIAFARSWFAFFILQFLRIGYQLDGTAEMYLATVTTERERTGALMRLTVPQAAAMFFGPVLGSKIAAFSSLRVSQGACGIAMFAALMPVLIFMLPTTHSIPRLASAKLRPFEYVHLIRNNRGLREGLVIRCMVVSAYVCYEMISRNFILRSFMQSTTDSAIVLLVMAISLLIMQFFILPIIQKRASPKALLQMSLVTLICSYLVVSFVTSFEQFLLITALQTGAYAVAYAESSTQITCAVETTELGKATGLASMAQWLVHFVLPIYASHLVQHWHYTYAFYTSALITTGTLAYVSLITRTTNAHQETLLPSMTANY